jgi:hypothetical protein
MPPGLADSILSLADGNVEYLLGKLDGIAGTLRHEPSIAQAAPPIYPLRFQTEALPTDAVRPLFPTVKQTKGQLLIIC